MKSTRILFGLSAILYVVAHLIELTYFIGNLDEIPEDIRFGQCVGKVLGIFFGLCIAVLCLWGRPEKKEPIW